MRTLMMSATALSVAFACAPASAQRYDYGNDDTYVRCESIDGRTRECPAPDGRVVLNRQLSRAACVEGRSWGESRSGVWVSQGCRAEFRVSPRNYGHGGWQNGGDIIRCSSDDGRFNRCALPGRGRIQLVRQESRAPCIEGRSWGQEGSSVWVNGGCRGDFARSGGSGGGWGRPEHGIGGRVFRCESDNGRTQECPANIRAGVQLVRQLSRAPCIEGRSWGYGRLGIWVSEGCRAEFRSY